MSTPHLIFLSCAIAVVALLYSSVGHGGASGYIAVMALAGLAPAEIRPIALILNILVATITTFQFWRSGHFDWRLFWPFAVLSIPAAYLGGYIHLPALILRLLLGVVLFFSAVRLFFRKGDPPNPRPPPLPVALGVGSAIGLLSGLTGTGGGIFLTPLVLFCQWARTRQAAAISALFILVNSIAGFVGFLSGRGRVPALAWPLLLAAMLGGTAGSYFGSRRFPVRVISLLLATVLIIAGLKLLLTH